MTKTVDVIPATTTALAKPEPSENTPAVRDQDKTSLEYWRSLADRRLLIAKHWYTKFNEADKERENALQNLVVAEGMLKDYTVLYDGETRKKIEGHKKLATQEVLAEIAACTEIDEVRKDHRPKISIKITLGLAVLLITVLAFYLYSSNAQFKAGVDKNLPFIAIIVGAAAFLGYWYFRKR